MVSQQLFVRRGEGHKIMSLWTKWIEMAPLKLKIGQIEAQSCCGAFGTTTDTQHGRRQAKKSGTVVGGPKASG